MNLFSLFLHQTSVYRNGAKNPHRGHWKKAEERIGVNVASAALSDPAAAAVAAAAAAATSTADAAATPKRRRRRRCHSYYCGDAGRPLLALFNLWGPICCCPFPRKTI